MTNLDTRTCTATIEVDKRHTRVLVGTNADEGPKERGERGVDILDAYGDLVYIPDHELPRVIALLASHLAGETVTFIAQEPVNAAWVSDELDEAMADVEQRLAALLARRQAIATRIAAIDAQLAAMPASPSVNYVSFTQFLLGRE